MAAQAILGNKTNQEVLRYARLLREANLRIEKLIVFGSRAKGTYHRDSDIDVCVVSKQFGKNLHDERVQLMHIRNDETINIEPHPYHPDDLNNKWDGLAHEIRTHGIEIT